MNAVIRLFLLPIILFSWFRVYSQTPVGRASSDTSSSFVIGVTEQFRSEILDEQCIINVYLPEGYNTSDTAHFPVVYLLDGSADEDFIHVAGLFQYCGFSWVNCAPPSIVVGIATVDRRRDFTFPTTIASDKEKSPTSGRSENFMKFLEEELQPYVARRFRTNGERMLIGQSLGGLLATEILFKEPGMFDRYLIVSPSLWWDDGSLIQMDPPLLNEKNDTQAKVYLAVGKEGLSPSEKPHVMEVDVNLLAEKIRASQNKNVQIYFDYLPDEDHATIMHQAVYNGLRHFFTK
ncbi:MAG: alpha/beta hydrolase-fold protein [Bacteroidota bacterium]|nr:alpha/beta hydrolase-fold protein [Bacteroidota bacterium]